MACESLLGGVEFELQGAHDCVEGEKARATPGRGGPFADQDDTDQVVPYVCEDAVWPVFACSDCSSKAGRAMSQSSGTRRRAGWRDVDMTGWRASSC